MVAPQQTEECSGATATQLQPQQCANTPMQQQHIAIEAVQETAAEAQTPLQHPSSALPVANFAMRISAAASSAAQKMHSIATHATSWWQRRRRNHAENANRMTEPAANADGQHAKELESTAASAAARTEQPEASSTTSAAADKKEPRTHNSSFDAARSHHPRFPTWNSSPSAPSSFLKWKIGKVLQVPFPKWKFQFQIGKTDRYATNQAGDLGASGGAHGSQGHRTTSQHDHGVLR